MLQTRFASGCVIGTGMMGPGIALTLALGGARVTLLSRTAAGAVRGLEQARKQGQTLIASELVDPSAATGAMEAITPLTDFDNSIAKADIVIESGPEDMSWKQELFARMGDLAPSEAVLASNTSGLSISDIASRCRRPERVLTTHFWNPPHLMPLVEIVQGTRTSPETVAAVRALLEACGKTPVVVKIDRPGQVGNRLQMALVREAANIVAEGIADAEAVDSVIKNGLGIRMPAYGVFEHMDVAGLDLALRVMEYVVPDLYNEPRAPEYLRQMVRTGQLGARTGLGFYDWSVKSADDVRAQRDAFLVAVLQYRRKCGETA
jgi:3-hydroxybutyryl-CoA dehydrogenase